MRKSTVFTESDQAGPYAVEVFDAGKPKGVIVCVHGRGVRREDGADFFYKVAEHYPDFTVLLADQNQFSGAGTCYLNPLPVAIARVQKLISFALEKYPGTPIVLLGHSLGCAIITQLDVSVVQKIVFVAPAAGKDSDKLIQRYGKDVAEGKLTVSSDGLKKYISKDYFESLLSAPWEDKYEKLLARFQPVYAFEAGAEEIVGDERLAHRALPFDSYKIIPGAKHNLAGQPLSRFFEELDFLLTA